MTDRKGLSSQRSKLTPEQRVLLERRLRGEAGEVRQIERRAERECGAASYAQERLWFLDQLRPDNSVYNISRAFSLKGELKVEALQRSLSEIVRRHEVLRTSFALRDGELVQVIAAAAAGSLQITDLSQLPLAERETEARRLTAIEAERAFDLEQGPLMRVSLMRLGEAEHVLVLVLHHIITDGWSTGILLRELRLLYQAYSAGQESPLGELAIQYADFAHWQREWLSGAVLEKQLGYWREQLAGAPPVLELPTDHARPAVLSHRGSRQSRMLPVALAKSLKQLSQQEGVTLFMTLLAGFQTLLYRYSNQEEFCLGTSIANRNRAEIEPLIGFFVNMLVLRADMGGNPSFRELLKRVREVCLGAYAHQDVPFEKLVEELEPERALSHTPLFQVVMVMQNTPRETWELAGLTVDPYGIKRETAKVDLMLTMMESEAGLVAVMEYDTELFEGETIARMLGHLEVLLGEVAVDAEQRVAEVELLSSGEREQLAAWNQTAAEYAQESCVHELFEAQVARTPEAIAVRCGDEAVSYWELNERANQLAHYLRGLGVRAESRVGICVERSIEMVVALLGTLKAGAAYVPLDPEYPLERLSFMIEDAAVIVLLTQSRLLPCLPQLDTKPICLDVDQEFISKHGRENLLGSSSPENLAYIIYTSGSTGTAKGVMIRHRGVANLVEAQRLTFGLTTEHRVLQFASLSFDASTFEIVMALIAGATLCVEPSENLLIGEPLLAVLRERRITHLVISPSALAALAPPELPDLELIVVAGEACSAEVVKRWGAGRGFYDAYGPTETTVWATGGTCEDSKTRPAIGRAVANTQVYVMDERHQVVPLGVPGELCIGGVGIARGYINRPELTAERFIPHANSSEAGARLYCTGDVARYRGDGELEFLGRKDHQVKVRGYRVELGEIESVLNGHPQVAESVVLARAGGDGEETGTRLVGYLVRATEQAVNVSKLRAYLQEKLPEYMVPGQFVLLEELPLNANGKVDRQGLPAPDQTRPELEEGYVAARTAEEEILVGIFQQVLKLEQVGIHDNFFSLGGHSLLATQVVSRIRQSFNLELPLRSFFETPNVAGLANSLQVRALDEEAVVAEGIAAVSRETALPLSFAQQRLWFLEQLRPGSNVYSIPMALRLRGELDGEALQRSITELIRRHEVLRTSFAVRDGELVQVIAAAAAGSLQITDLGQLPLAERETEARRLTAIEAERAFDLEQGPLMRVSLMRLGEAEHVLVLVLHHIITDGWSTGILLRELRLLYQAYSAGQESPLGELAIQYADFAHWQREWLSGAVLEKQLGYWREQLAGAPPVLELPTDHARPAVQSHRGSRQSRMLPVALAESLKQLSQQEGVTLFMTLLAGFQTLLYRYSNQEEFCLGTSIANRNRAEIEPLIGFFVNMLVLRADMGGNPSFRELLKRVREVCLGAYAHQDVPFEKLVEELEPERALSHTPLFQVVMVMQNTPRETWELAGLTVDPYGIKRETAKVDLMLTMMESEAGLVAVMEYDTELFEGETIARMLGHLEVLLGEVAVDAEQRVAEVELLSSGEREQLAAWNQTAAEYAQESCVHELFEAQVARTPEAIAVRCGDEAVSYWELNERANQLAHYLRGLGVRAESRVGICVERSIEMVVALLGTLKAGAAYVPLDPEYPLQRLSFMIEDAAVMVLLTQSHLLNKWLPPPQCQSICLDHDWSAITQHSTKNPRIDVTSANLAYVIYTSGSTGKPKGSVSPHYASLNRFEWMWRAFPFTEDDVCCQKTSLSFGDSVWEIFGPLLKGVPVVIIPDAAVKDPRLFIETLSANRITRLVLVPSLLRVLLDQPVDLRSSLSCLKYWTCSGEALPVDLARRFKRQLPDSVLLNLYGSSELAADATCYQVNQPEELDTILIGRPIANTGAYVLDARMKPVPLGVHGDLYIGGAGIARGYIDRPELTAERFIPHANSSEAGARLYCTGDVARYRGDGELEFLGRKDHQVKVRGYRVELGEIESVLNGHPQVAESVVLARAGGDGEETGTRLVGYLVRATEQAVNVSKLRAYLQEKLPEYMVPGQFVLLEELPLNANGKVDRQGLPAPDQTRPELEEGYVAARTAEEEILVGIFQQVLKLEQVGIHDNFFSLGGHSLLATQVVSRIRQSFNLELPLRSFFETPNVAGLANSLQVRALDEEAVVAEGIAAVSRETGLPLSFAQQRLWFLEQLRPGSNVYSIPMALRLRGELDGEALQRSLSEIVRRHEVLRTNFRMVEGKAQQVIRAAAAVDMEVVELSQLPLEEREPEARRLTAAAAERAFDLEQGPLMRVSLMRLGEAEHVLVLVLHHIITDGWSMGIMFRELKELYRAYSVGQESPLGELAIQYADFAHWQRERLRGAVLEEQLGYWREQLRGAPAVLELPTEQLRPAVQSHEGARQSRLLPAGLAESLKQLSQQEGVTLFMTLLAGFETLLYRYSRQEDFCIGADIANRNRAEIEPLIGFFVNMLVLRADLSGNPSFRELLKRVREVCLGAYAHQDVPFEKLVEELEPERALSHTPLFQVVMVLQNTPRETVELSGLEMSGVEVEVKTAQFDLILSVSERRDGGLLATMVYNTELFAEETIGRLLVHLEVLLGAVAADAEQRVGEVELLSAGEQAELQQWQGSDTPYPAASCVHELFEEQVKLRPEAIAVRYQEQELSYEQLNERANQLAHHLLGLGVTTETRVGLCVERSLELVVGVLGILKAGAAYVPLDPEHPLERLSYLMADAELPVVLTQERWAERMPADGGQMICLDLDWPQIAAESRATPAIKITPDNLAYLVYTSGSTGQPKGAAIPHRSIGGLIFGVDRCSTWDEKQTLLQYSSLSWDALTLELWPALLRGGRCVLYAEPRVSLPSLAAVIKDEGVSVLWLTSSLFNAVLDTAPELLRGVSQVLVGGEALSGRHVRQARELWPEMRLVNGYGPSEATVFACCHVSTNAEVVGSSVPIGRPIGDRKVYVLDGHLKRVPVGVAGELYIGGASLARGYWKQAGLTAERFIPHPYSEAGGERLYRTGDLVRHRSDGELEFVGRVDEQVKVRGYRIELGEIESVLKGHAAVAECVVVAGTDGKTAKAAAGLCSAAE